MHGVPSPARTDGLGSLALLASAIAGAIGVVFIVLMYAAFAVGAHTTGLTFGWMNDVAVLAQYLLAVPGVLAIGTALRADSPRLARLGTPLALVEIAVIAGVPGAARARCTHLRAGDRPSVPGPTRLRRLGGRCCRGRPAGGGGHRADHTPDRRFSPRSTWASQSGRTESAAGCRRSRPRARSPPRRPSTHPDSTCPRDRRRCLSCRHPGAVVKRPSQSVVAGMPLAGTRARSTRRLVAASRWSRRLGTGRHPP